MNAPRFLGLDLAWSAANPSGLAALDGEGTLFALRADLRGDDQILDWVRAHLGTGGGAIAIDMPTIVTNRSGRRCCEAELARDFARHHAGPYPANLARFPDGGRARALLDRLRADGVVETLEIAPHDRRTVAFEAFPHPAAVRLFGLERVIPYKKKRRAWPAVLDAWARYRSLLGTLRDADPPLCIPAELLPARLPDSSKYKAWDDKIDAVMCAYVASFVWRHGTASGRVVVYGDMDGGHIVVPACAAVAREAAASRVHLVP
ncbi:hypothetical protein WPS_18870 [Vulcanimicrobium alpinum]|uniref:DUF429 domain-containing protein n=1 Tax=Vulcanimicrobium alpinum TaxID=3016050 RepID=A0AAN2CA14_UNVUL|nr:DUF429 domain-containing protein [Vulcanimicrobium alpinum]BDE06611.1 hypothetical protein WPS_18870 [Vulcanimicrobium alpinum]